MVAPGKPLAHRILLSSPQLLALGASRRVGTTDPPALHGLSGPLEIFTSDLFSSEISEKPSRDFLIWSGLKTYLSSSERLLWGL